MNSVIEAEPKLEAPGAGLPYPELLAARLLFHGKRVLASRESAQALFEGQRQAVVRLARGCSVEQGNQRVLIKRLRGMEDSSRHWSVFMTLDHLRIVNFGCMEAIRSLSRGEVPARTASTAAVKPSPEVDAGIIEKFEQGCDLFSKTVAGVADLKTSARYAHPWFGPLDAAGWHFIAGFHMQLHRRQIEAIFVGLSDNTGKL